MALVAQSLGMEVTSRFLLVMPVKVNLVVALIFAQAASTLALALVVRWFLLVGMRTQDLVVMLS